MIAPADEANANVHRLPLTERDVETSWSALDQARLRLDALYADAATPADERLEQCRRVAMLWQQWQQLFLRSAG